MIGYASSHRQACRIASGLSRGREPCPISVLKSILANPPVRTTGRSLVPTNSVSAISMPPGVILTFGRFLRHVAARDHTGSRINWISARRGAIPNRLSASAISPLCIYPCFDTAGSPVFTAVFLKIPPAARIRKIAISCCGYYRDRGSWPMAPVQMRRLQRFRLAARPKGC